VARQLLDVSPAYQDRLCAAFVARRVMFDFRTVKPFDPGAPMTASSFAADDLQATAT
jgi:hypothetical protein